MTHIHACGMEAFSPNETPSPTHLHPNPTSAFPQHSAFPLLMHMLPLKKLNGEGGLCIVSTGEKHCLNGRSYWVARLDQKWGKRDEGKEELLNWPVLACSSLQHFTGTQRLLPVPSSLGVAAYNWLFLIMSHDLLSPDCSLIGAMLPSRS